MKKILVKSRKYKKGNVFLGEAFDSHGNPLGQKRFRKKHSALPIIKEIETDE